METLGKPVLLVHCEVFRSIFYHCVVQYSGILKTQLHIGVHTEGLERQLQIPARQIQAGQSPR